MKKKFLFLLLVSLTAGGYFYWQHVIMQKTANQNFVDFHGNVEIRRANLGFRVFGRLDAFNFEEGDRIKAGDIIAALDKRPYAESIAVAQSSLGVSTAKLEQLENGTRPQEIEQAKAMLEEQRASLTLAETDFDRAEKLLSRNAISQADHDLALARRDESQARVRRMEESLRLLEEGARKEEISAAKAQQSQAKAVLAQTMTALEDTELRSPNRGILLTRTEEPGAVVQPGQTIAVVSLDDFVWVHIYVSLQDFGIIKEGAPVEIFTDSPSNELYKGQIGHVSSQAEFTPKNVETRELRTNLVYRVRVIVVAPDSGLKQGMPVRVRVSCVCS